MSTPTHQVDPGPTITVPPPTTGQRDRLGDHPPNPEAGVAVFLADQGLDTAPVLDAQGGRDRCRRSRSAASYFDKLPLRGRAIVESINLVHEAARRASSRTSTIPRTRLRSREADVEIEVLAQIHNVYDLMPRRSPQRHVDDGRPSSRSKISSTPARRQRPRSAPGAGRPTLDDDRLVVAAGSAAVAVQVVRASAAEGRPPTTIGTLGPGPGARLSRSALSA